MATTKTSTKNKKSAWRVECEKIEKQINEITLGIEANIVATLYAKPELLYQYDFTLTDFNSNVWRVYWAIINELIINEKKNEIDELVVGFYLQKHTKLSEKYDTYGGWNTIQQATQYIKVENFDSQVKELHKWNTIKTMMKQGFPVANDFSNFADMSLDDIYDLYNVRLNHIFANADCEVKSYDISDGLEEYIDKLDKGEEYELEVDSMPLLNNMITTFKRGHLYGIGANTGTGKTTMALRMVLPSIISQKKKLLILLNESDQTQVQVELITYIANNIFKQELQKRTLKSGHFSDETKELLKKCVNYINELKEQHLITIIPLETFSVDLCVKLIQKYSSLGVSHIILDTFKMPLENRKEASWLEMTKDSVKLYDIAKSSNRNLCLIMTYQLNKSSINRRHLNNDCVGQSKSILDVMSCNLMFRRPFDDEYDGGSHEIIGYRLEGKQGKTKLPFKLDKEKQYLICSCTKNRFGITDEYSIIVETDFSRNIIKELGICYVPEDVF
jgi:replicative DNA helicase